MYNNGNSSKNVTGASVVDGTLENADFADNAISGDKIDAGIISNFQSTGIDDRLPTGKILTLSTTGVDVTGSITCDDYLKIADSAVLGNVLEITQPNLLDGVNGAGISFGLNTTSWSGALKFKPNYATPDNSTVTMYVSETAVLTLDGNGNVKPSTDDSFDLGSSAKRWDDIYATNGTIQTSDERNKEEVEITDLGLVFINSLTPVAYKFKNYTQTIISENENGDEVTEEIEKTFTRKHQGLLAQQVEEVLNGKDFAGLIYDEESDRYGLRYTEFVAPLIKAVQELTARIEQLENN